MDELPIIPFFPFTFGTFSTFLTYEADITVFAVAIIVVGHDVLYSVGGVELPNLSLKKCIRVTGYRVNTTCCNPP